MMIRSILVAALLAVTGCGDSDVQVIFANDSASLDDTNSVGSDSAVSNDAASDTLVTPTDGGTVACKRGLAYGYNSVADLKTLSKGVSWWYNWSPTPDNAAVASAFAGLGLDFAPMVWGESFTPTDIESKMPAKGSSYLLGFNEPNFFSQANLTPKEAAALWPQIESIAAAKGLKIVSPALNYCGGGCNVTDPYDWFDQFFAACPSCKIDAIAVHWYACTKSALTNYLGKFETKFGKPLWLTEFSCLDSSDTSEPVQQAYMKDALAVLEADPMVQRYAWFIGRSTMPTSISLLGADGELTPLGKTYVEWPQTCK